MKTIMDRAKRIAQIKSELSNTPKPKLLDSSIADMNDLYQACLEYSWWKRKLKEELTILELEQVVYDSVNNLSLKEIEDNMTRIRPMFVDKKVENPKDRLTKGILDTCHHEACNRFGGNYEYKQKAHKFELTWWANYLQGKLKEE
jgi:hypothetical protein